jgi:hypothetical protein
VYDCRRFSTGILQTIDGKQQHKQLFLYILLKKLRNVLKCCSKKVGSNVDQRVFGELVEMRLPKLAAHFSEIGE